MSDTVIIPLQEVQKDRFIPNSGFRINEMISYFLLYFSNRMTGIWGNADPDIHTKTKLDSFHPISHFALRQTVKTQRRKCQRRASKISTSVFKSEFFAQFWFIYKKTENMFRKILICTLKHALKCLSRFKNGSNLSMSGFSFHFKTKMSFKNINAVTTLTSNKFRNFKEASVLLYSV